MDILKNISNKDDRDIIVSIPEDKTWLEYLNFFLELKVSGATFNIIVPTVPKTSPGKRCFIVYDGFIRGFLEIARMTENADNDIVIELIPILVSTPHKMPMGDIDGFKYLLDNSNTQ